MVRVGVSIGSAVGLGLLVKDICHKLLQTDVPLLLLELADAQNMRTTSEPNLSSVPTRNHSVVPSVVHDVATRNHRADVSIHR